MLSRTISRHHWYMVSRRRIRPRTSRVGVAEWNQVARPEVSRKAALAPVNGHGLGSTMW